MAKQIQLTQRAVIQRQTGNLPASEAIKIGPDTQLTLTFETIADEMRDEELRLLALRNDTTRRSLQQSWMILIAGTLLGFFITGVAGWSAQHENSAREVAEKALRGSEEQYWLLVNGAQDYAIFMLDPNGLVISWSAGAQRIKGYNADEIIGRNFSCFFQSEDQNLGRPAEILKLAAETGRHEDYGLRVRKDGSRFPADVIVTALRDNAGKLRGFAEVTRDVTRSAELEAKYRALLEAAPDAMVVVNQTGDIVLVNAQAERQFGYKRDELIGQSITTLIPEGFAERLVADALRSKIDMQEQQIGTGIELSARCKDGYRFPIEIMLSPLVSVDGVVVTAAIRNITTRKMAEAALLGEKRLAQTTLNCIGDAIACTDIYSHLTFLNVAAEKMTGWSLREALARPVHEIFLVRDGTGGQLLDTKTITEVEQNNAPRLPGNEILVRRDGFEIPIERSVSKLIDELGDSTGSVLVFRDVKAARDMALQMSHLAEHDSLTGLPNRLLLNDRIGQAIAMASRHQTTVTLMFLDLDGFKHINDSLGHPIGDRLLQLVAKRLLKCVEASDTVSRQGGDEFVVLLAEVDHPADSIAFAKKILNSVAKVYSIDGSDLHVTTSIGISVYPEDGVDAETLLKNADTAMYQAKEGGRQAYQFFEPGMNVQAVERQSMEEEIRRALQRQEFTLHYQPKIDLKTGHITGAEALIRWLHPVQGSISPAQFIPIAEDCGLILPIGRWVLREACRQARSWVDAGLPAINIAVNISAIDFRDDDFLTNVTKTLQETGWDPRALELELTESVLMKRADAAETTLKRLRTLGIKVALDDFGTGYSSLSYLRKFSIDTLKIDQSFIRELTVTPDETTIVASMISMGRSLKLRVVAEGVETEGELAFLLAHGCDEAQGYYFSRPVPPDEFAKLFATSPFRLAVA